MAALPTEMITEILLRLPVKSLLRFKCVCKFWNSIIKTPNFIKLHLNQTLISNSNLQLLFFYKSLYSADLDHNHISFSGIQLPLSTQGIEVFGSCNGIVCIGNKTEILLFNPLTKSQFKLPIIPDLNRVVRLFGFGYDSKNDDYRVLKLVQCFLINDMGKFVEAELYSCNDNSWKSVQGIYDFTPDYHRHGVLVSEALHFNARSNKSDYIIVSFDLQTESFLFFDYSKLIDDTEFYVTAQLTELGRCLCAFVNYHDELREYVDFWKCDIWVMKEYGNNESWVRLFSIGNKCILRCQLVLPIVYSKDGKKFLLGISDLIFGWYDLESKKFDAINFKLHGMPRDHLMMMGRFVGCYVGSLVSIEDKLRSQRETLPMIKKKK
uniref:F-box domain-containing protein n=2 Tax=Chenopodium quinoa TaxID=63459 RepID=A0A803LRF5_CHEQI